VACGKGGDMWKWINGGAQTVLGIDYAGDNITNPNDGAYRRYMDAKQKLNQRIPNMAFVIGDSSKRLSTGEAGANPEEADILRSVFGMAKPKGSVPPYIQKVMTNALPSGSDIVACMFALHYFFESTAKLTGFLDNLSDIVKPGGFFVGCCFDGQRVFDLLRRTKLHDTITRSENDVPIWSITKEYDQTDFYSDEPTEGMAIDVEFITIGSKHREYLVNFDYLVRLLSERGFRLLNEREMVSMNLKYSTNTFESSHDMAARNGLNYPMLDSVKEFSFLNRWFIFTRDADNVIPITPPMSPVEDIEEVEEVPSTDDIAAEAAAAPTGFRVPPRDKTWEPQQIFSFGADAVRKDILRVTNSKGKPDVGIGRWMSLAAPFPIPDPMPNLDDPSAEAIPKDAIMYPTIEHYLAGMKLKHALVTPRRPGEPDLGQLIMSSDGDIHQEAEKERREAMRRKPFLPESDDDYKLLTKEAQKVRKFLTTKKTLNQYKAHISDDKWLPIRDKYLRDALRYRFKYDERFQKAVLAAKDDKKYLLHSKTSTNSNIEETSEIEGAASELYGKRDPNRKIILGKNKVGLMLMEIAGFQF
jgi:predicted NAD-dependent protein-ADP-ribosyltransferase YbiA (DUF1768 family)